MKRLNLILITCLALSSQINAMRKGFGANSWPQETRDNNQQRDTLPTFWLRIVDALSEDYLIPGTQTIDPEMIEHLEEIRRNLSITMQALTRESINTLRQINRGVISRQEALNTIRNHMTIALEQSSEMIRPFINRQIRRLDTLINPQPQQHHQIQMQRRNLFPEDSDSSDDDDYGTEGAGHLFL